MATNHRMYLKVADPMLNTPDIPRTVTVKPDLWIVPGTKPNARIGQAEMSPAAGMARMPIEQARWVLDLKSGWDDEDAFPIASAVFDRMAEVVERILDALGDAPHVSSPEIGPIADGSLAVHWRCPDRVLILNFPADTDKLPVIHMNADDGTAVQGTLGRDLEEDLPNWLGRSHIFMDAGGTDFGPQPQGDTTSEAGGWLRFLDAEDREAMREELVPLQAAASLSGDWQAFREAVEAWRATADVLSDPALVASLSAPWDPAEEIELVRP